LYRLNCYDFRYRGPRGVEPDLGQQQNELVAPEPRQQISSAQVAFRPMNDRAEELIPRSVPKLVVDGLETVHVDVGNGKRALVALRAV
jgi:hypothetical protein